MLANVYGIRALLSLIVVIVTAFVSDKAAGQEYVWGYRAPVGHTHTCGNGHTWDHQANPGHICLSCGLSQYTQDRSPRRVLFRRPAVVQPVDTPWNPPVARTVTAVTTTRVARVEWNPPAVRPVRLIPLVAVTVSGVSGGGGCVGGFCPAASSPRVSWRLGAGFGGWFRGR